MGYEERAVIEQIAEAAEEAYEMDADAQQEELIVGGDDEGEEEEEDDDYDDDSF